MLHSGQVSITESEKAPGDKKTDTMLAPVKSLEGYNEAQVFSGSNSGMKKVYGMRTESQVHQALEDFILDVGALYCIHSDNY